MYLIFSSVCAYYFSFSVFFFARLIRICELINKEKLPIFLYIFYFFSVYTTFAASITLVFDFLSRDFLSMASGGIFPKICLQHPGILYLRCALLSLCPDCLMSHFYGGSWLCLLYSWDWLRVSGRCLWRIAWSFF